MTEKISPQGSRLVVTGANGFLGRGLIESLRGSRWEIDTLVRNPSNSVEPHVTEHVIGDLTKANPDELQPLFNQADCVLHLAAAVPGKQGGLSSTTTADIADIVGSAIAQCDVGRVIVMSSAYAELAELGSAQARDYGHQKLAADGILEKHLSPKTPLIFLRPPVVYGDGASGSLVAMSKAVARKIPIPFGSLHNERRYISKTNLLHLIRTIMDLPQRALPHNLPRKYVPTDGVAVTTTEFVNAMAEALNVSTRQLAVPPWLLDALGALVGQSEAISGATKSMNLDDNARLFEDFGWSPIERFPASVDAWLRQSDSERY